ncbi:MAG TPA: ATP-binding protein [Micromonosporaceae bacterium]|jgi:two-component system sensor histidine kinase KdpD
MATVLNPPRSRARAWIGAAVGLVALSGLTLGLIHGDLTLTSIALLYLVPVVVVAAIGGVWLGLAAAAASDLVLNWFFVPPFHTLAVDRRDNLIALLVYVLVAVAVAVAVDLAARQRAAAARSGIEAQLLARISTEPVAGGSLPRLLAHIQTTFGMTSVALLEGEEVVASVGPPFELSTPTLSASGNDRVRLVADGPAVFAEDRRLLGRLAAAAARTLEATRQAEQAAELAEVDRLRTAILASVGHDLRTPLASIKAAASSLRAPDVSFSAADREELLATVEESADRLSDLVENLLAMSRLQAGVLSAELRPVALDEVVARALLHAGAPDVRVLVSDDLPLVRADPGLLERVVANLISNAVKAAAGRPVEIRGASVGAAVDLTIIDHGTGIPRAERDRVFAPFQRLDDKRADGGLGLGLAIARGFTDAMGGTLTPSDTSGGGLTMTLSLPASA